MAKKKVNLNAMRQGMQKAKTVEEIEDAVSKIHDSKVPVPVPPKVEKAKVEKPKREIKKKELVRLSLDIPKSLHSKFKIFAISKDSNMKELIIEFIESQLSK